MIRPYADSLGNYKGKWSGKLELPPMGVYSSLKGNGVCRVCHKKASRTPFFLETALPGYKLRFCWCSCGEKWVETRKLYDS